jgi:hypothetical protein
VKSLLVAFLSMFFVTQLASGQVTLSRDEAMDAPNKHAWDLFQLLNHPAADPVKGRGLPDLSKNIGAPGTMAVWETWRLARTEVFLANDERPPDWNDLSLPGSPTDPANHGKVPEPTKPEILKSPALAKNGAHILFDPPDGIFKGHGGFGETRMNRAAYEFIQKEHLYSAAGAMEYAKAYLAKQKPAIAFPVDAIEIKVAWRELTPNELASGADKTFYVATLQGKTYGLVTLHIITKDVPNWFWATFHHVSSPATAKEIPDTFGRPRTLDGTVWQNYVLGGVQTDFITTTGSTILLSDAYLEKGFERSSCITCHANATVGPPGGKSSLSQDLNAALPKPNDFEGLAQTDFVWSIPFRMQ